MAMKSFKVQFPMSKMEFRGRRKQLKGKVRERIAKLRRHRRSQLKGKLEQVEGKARVKLARVIRKTKKSL